MNWSHSFQVALEKRGFVDLEIWTYAQFQRSNPDEQSIGAFFVGPCVDDGLTPDDVKKLSTFDCPTFIENHSLSQAALAELKISGPLRDDAANQTLRLAGEEGELQKILKCFHPLLAENEGATFILPDGQIQTRYEPPSPMALRISPNDTVEIKAAKAALKLAFAYCKRMQKDNEPFAKPGLSTLCAFGLYTLSLRIPAGEHKNFLHQAASDMLRQAACRIPDQKKIRLLLDIVKNTSPSAPDLKKGLLAVLETAEIKQRDKDNDTGPHAVLQSENITEIAARAIKEDPDVAHRLMLAMTESRLDEENGAFFNLTTGAGTDTQGKRYSNHPLVLLALSLLPLPFGQVLPSYLSPRSMAITDENARTWLMPPAFFKSTTDCNQKTYIYYDGACQTPAVWSQDQFVFLGFPALALIGHMHTLPPLDAPLFGATDYLGLLLEELLFSIFTQRLARSTCMVLQIMPWKNNKPPMIIRHDVDRHPDDESFQELIAFYDSQNIRSSWYWMLGRLDRGRISELADNGHEIGLHALSATNKQTELAEIKQCSGKDVKGECFHGAGAEYHRGAPSVIAAAQAGLLYTEINPGVYGFPFLTFPQLGPEGEINYLTDLVHLTFSLTTDGVAGQSRKTKVTMNQELAQIWARQLGYYICLLNHPDINRTELISLIKSYRDSGGEFCTAEKLALWWRATHRKGAASLTLSPSAPDKPSLAVTTAGLPEGTVINIYATGVTLKNDEPERCSITHTSETRPGTTQIHLAFPVNSSLLFSLEPSSKSIQIQNSGA